MVVYKIANLLDGKTYIGQTVGSVKKRWSQHTTSKKNTPMYAAMRKHGVDSFSLEILCSAIRPEYLNELETHFIAYYGCMSPSGYNLTSGGDSAFRRSEHTKAKQREAVLGHGVSEETRRKISLALTGRPGGRKGMKASDETRKRISQAQTGKTISPETRRKMSESNKIRLIGKPRTEAQLAALKQTHEKNRGRIPWNKGLRKEAT